MTNKKNNNEQTNTKVGVYTRNGEDFQFKFKTSLSAREKVKFVNSVVETVVGEHYNSIIQDLVFDFYVIEIMTEDVDTSEVLEEAFDAVTAMEQFVEETNIVEIVTAFNGELIDELRKAVDLDVEYKVGIHKNPITESLSSLLNAIEKKVEGFDLDGMMDMANALSGMSGEMTMENLIDAYASSDAMKERYSQLLASPVA